MPLQVAAGKTLAMMPPNSGIPNRTVVGECSEVHLVKLDGVSLGVVYGLLGGYPLHPHMLFGVLCAGKQWGLQAREAKPYGFWLANCSGTDESNEENLGYLETCDEIRHAGVLHLSGTEPSDSRERLCVTQCMGNTAEISSIT